MSLTERRLTEIWIYPIKSLGGIKVTRTKVQAKGLQYDRRWMLIDANGTFLTQRTSPILALFKVSLESDALIVKFNGNSVSIPLEPEYCPAPVLTKVWDDDISAHEISDSLNRWFTEQLGESVKLLYFPEKNARPVDPRYAVNNEHVSLADGYPFLIIGEASLADLNSRLEQPVPMNRFRPNFVFSGEMPYEEDQWRNFTIGDNQFVGVKPCGRCVMTTVDQNTAEKGAEPLRTLSAYRRVDNKVMFGQNVVAIDLGTVSVGDLITLH